MKRTDDIVDFDLYAALFNDIATWDGNLREDLDADYQRLVRTVTSRGIPFIMIDMPEAGKLLDRSLSSGCINATNLPNTFGKLVDKSSREFLSCLFAKIFDGSGYIYSDVDPTSIFFLRQVLYLAKKVRKDCSDAAILSEVEEFKRIDERLRDPSLSWDLDHLDIGERALSYLDSYIGSPDLFSERSRVPRILLQIFDGVCGIVFSQFPIFDWRDIIPKHGPGAVADARSGTDKYRFPNWPAKLGELFPYEYFAQPREDLHCEVATAYCVHEPPARLLAVPKTLKAPRLIASEPIAHQFLQQGVMRWLRENLPLPLRTCVDFKSQEPSRQLCLKASRDSDLATVDLSSASDRLSCWTVERALKVNPPLLRALHACRTRWLVNATGSGERFFLKLKKFAAQGASITFPIQSMVYACMAIACVCYEDSIPLTRAGVLRASRKLRVYGDDIILPSRAVCSLDLLMAHCELKVNVSKTHYRGKFRESCGMDAYDGEDVSPLYLRDLGPKSTADGLDSWVAVSNNAYAKGLWSLSDVMARKIPGKIRKLIPVSSENLGILTLRMYQAGVVGGKRRINPDLHRNEVLGLQLSAKLDKRRREDHQNLLQYFLEKPHPETNWSAGYLVRSRFQLRKRWVAA